MTEVTVYIAPNIRQQTIETLTARMEQRRGRRMLSAIELNQTRAAKLEKMRDKDSEKFSKEVDKASKFLDQAAVLMGKADEAIRTATALHNNIALAEQAIG